MGKTEKEKPNPYNANNQLFMFTMKGKEMKGCSKEWNMKGKKEMKVGEKRDYKK